MPWETKDTIANIPKGYVKWYEWAYKPEGIKQVGCIYTVQGFEFDYIGVIIGPDLRYDTEQQCLITDIKEIKDPMLKRNAAYFDNYARNIYRVLMSRGMKGCYVYCCDENLKEYLNYLLFRWNWVSGSVRRLLRGRSSIKLEIENKKVWQAGWNLFQTGSKQNKAFVFGIIYKKLSYRRHQIRR